MSMVRGEYPRPQFERKEWINLNGRWDFKMDPDGEWGDICVPFVFQSKCSGIGSNQMCDKVTYRKTIIIPESWNKDCVILNFGAVDYACKIYVNDNYIGEHIGGNIGFSFDITEALNWEKEVITVEVYDPCEDETIPRGKQYWLEKPDAIWYTRTTGIWQTVWCERVPKTRIDFLKFTSNIDMGTVQIDYKYSGEYRDCKIEFDINLEGERVVTTAIETGDTESFVILDVFKNKIFNTSTHNDGWCWSPSNPKLFLVTARLKRAGQVLDEVKSYFGMRKIHIESGRVYLNNRPFYQKLVLDQGYWKDSLMTAEKDEDFKKDIMLAKEMGFNGCRKHQKAEDPRFLYWADKLGYIVWEEIGACAQYSTQAAQRTMKEWMEAVERDYNHPCIVAWVPLNESWGVPFIADNRQQQAFSAALYYQLKALDTTRLVVGNDGWEMTKTDICAIHNYSHGSIDDFEEHERFRITLSEKEEILNTYPANRKIFADGWSYSGEPIMLTEFGGISFVENSDNAWGYTLIKTGDDLEKEYERILKAISESECLSGFCYTQLTDVEQETNGLLTCERNPKIDLDKIRKINENVGKKRIKTW